MEVGGGSTFGRVLAIALGAVAIGAVSMWMLDGHGHTCDTCGTKWRHFGAFNLGSEDAHTCSRCGAKQWWKDGVSAEVKAQHAHWHPQMVENASPDPYPPEVMANVAQGMRKSG